MEIKQLDNGDLNRALEFLSRDYLYNAETIGIIEKIGLEGKFFQLYGLFETSCENLIATLFVSRGEGTLYLPSYDESNCRDFASFFRMLVLMSKNLNLESLSVDFSLREVICEFFEVKGSKNQYLCVYNPHEIQGETIRNIGSGEGELYRLKRAEQLQNLADLHFRSFGRGMNAWKYRSLVSQELVRLYGIYIGDELVCKGEWMCADPKMGYISGLCTDMSHRGRGLCSSLVRAMTAEILKSGSMPVLSYEEERLRRFYDVLGFECMYIRSVLWLII